MKVILIDLTLARGEIENKDNFFKNFEIFSETQSCCNLSEYCVARIRIVSVTAYCFQFTENERV